MKHGYFAKGLVISALFTLFLAGFCELNIGTTTSHISEKTNNPVVFHESIHPKVLAMTCTVVAPNGGEILFASSVFNITWTISGGTAPYTSNVKFYNDTTRTMLYSIVGSDTNTYYRWTVPNHPSLTCKINLTVTDSSVPVNAAFDESNAYWTIKPLPLQYRVVSPLGGENWTSGTSHIVEVAYGTNQGWGTLHLSFMVTWDNGSTFYFIAKSLTGTNNTNWMAGAPGPKNTSSLCYIRVLVNDSSPSTLMQSVTNRSDSLFSIFVPPPIPLAITLTAPSGGASWMCGSNQLIKWSISGGVTPYGPVKIEWTINTTWNLITSTAVAATGQYTWHLPYLENTSVSAYVRVTVTDNYPEKANATNTPAFIMTVPTPPSIGLNTPYGGELWGIGTTQNISWSVVVNKGVWPILASLSYTTQGVSGVFSSIVANINVTKGYYLWPIPNTPSNQCYVKLVVVDSYAFPRTITDMSKSAFTILLIPSAPNVTVISPAGGATWSSNQTKNIQWNRTGSDKPFSTYIDYSIDAKGNWTSITMTATDSGSASSYAWTVPNKYSTKCYIRITVQDKYSQTTIAYSDQFTISNKPPAQIGNIQGMVLDAHSIPLPNVSVSLQENSAFYTLTDKNGSFKLLNVPVGTYILRASKDGYKNISVFGVVVRFQTTTTVDTIYLQLIPPLGPDPTMMYLIGAMVIVVMIIVILILVVRYRSTQKAAQTKKKVIWVNAGQYPQHQAYQPRHHKVEEPEPGPRGSGTLPMGSKPVQAEQRPMDTQAELVRLQEMKDKGLLSQEEYEFSKNRFMHKDVPELPKPAPVAKLKPAVSAKPGVPHAKPVAKPGQVVKPKPAVFTPGVVKKVTPVQTPKPGQSAQVKPAVTTPSVKPQTPVTTAPKPAQPVVAVPKPVASAPVVEKKVTVAPVVATTKPVQPAEASEEEEEEVDEDDLVTQALANAEAKRKEKK